ncbi:hypothetical protein ACFYUH_22235 [Streptomyces fimicarius]|uniref:hypothetical protein n=1 Tax=Streptomyces griseus TaxID=1911 RepID=UPI00369154A6
MPSIAVLAAADLPPRCERPLEEIVFSLADLVVPDDAWSPRVSVPGLPEGGRRTHAGTADIQHLHHASQVFAEAVDLHGAIPVRGPLAAYLALTVTPLLNTPCTLSVHQGLLSAAAQLAFLQSRVCSDAAAPARAQRYARLSAQLAQEADDRTAFALALRQMSTLAHELGHRQPVVRNLVERAATEARDSAPAVRSYILAQLAVTQADHDPGAALRSLKAAEDLEEQTDQQPGPFTTYPRGALRYQRALTLTATGDILNAIHALRSSLRHRTARERQATALTRARLAETLLRKGHLEEAVQEWELFLDAYPVLHSERIEQSLSDMCRRLRPYAQHSRTAMLLERSRTVRP